MTKQQRNSAHYHFEQFWRGLILLGFSYFFYQLVVTGDIAKYINPRLTNYIGIVSVVFLVMALTQFVRVFVEKQVHNIRVVQRISYIIFVIPFILAVGIPTKTLDAAMVDKKGIDIRATPTSIRQTLQPESIVYPDPIATKSVTSTSEIPAETGTTSKQTVIDTAITAKEATTAANLTIPINQEPQQRPSASAITQSAAATASPDKVVVTDDNYVRIMATLYEAPDVYKNKTIEMIGFVYRKSGFSPQQFAAIRFIISCCAADAVPEGVLVEWPQAPALATNTWVKVMGKVVITPELQPVIKAVAVQVIPEPANTYIYHQSRSGRGIISIPARF